MCHFTSLLREYFDPIQALGAPMTYNFTQFISAILKIKSSKNAIKLTVSCIALIAGCHLESSVFAASQDSLRPNPPAPSVLDPQSDKDGTGPSINQKKQPAQSSVDDASQTMFRVKAIKFVGNTIYSTDDLMKIIQDDKYVLSSNSKMTFQQLQKIAAKITAFYQDNGYLVGQAVIPQQDITDGTVTIHIIEGRIDHVWADKKAWNKENKLVSEFERIYNDTQITNDKLTGVMARLGEATGTVGSINLQPSNKSGGSDVVLYTRPLPLFFYGFTADNYGSKSTGEYRTNAFVGGNSWITDGDYTRFEFGATNEFKRSHRFDLTYSIPFGFSGWTGSVRAWSTEYNLGGTFSSTRATGEAQAGEAAVSYALQRSNSARADWKSGYSYINLSDKLGTVNLNRDRHMQDIWTGISGYFEDTLLKNRARTIYASIFTGGQLDYDDAAAKAEDATGRKTKGTFGVVSGSLSREQVVYDNWSLYTSGRGQVANKNLDSYHKMSLGGPTAVRAYAGGESAGDNAVIGTAELRYLYSFSLFDKDTSARLAGFYDLGWSRIDASPVPSTKPTVNTATRGGYGAELNIFWNNSIAWQIFWAHTADNTRISQADGKRSRVGTTLSASF